MDCCRWWQTTVDTGEGHSPQLILHHLSCAVWLLARPVAPEKKTTYRPQATADNRQQTADNRQRATSRSRQAGSRLSVQRRPLAAQRWSAVWPLEANQTAGISSLELGRWLRAQQPRWTRHEQEGQACTKHCTLHSPLPGCNHCASAPPSPNRHDQAPCQPNPLAGAGRRFSPCSLLHRIPELLHPDRRYIPSTALSRARPPVPPRLSVRHARAAGYQFFPGADCLADEQHRELYAAARDRFYCMPRHLCVSRPVPEWLRRQPRRLAQGASLEASSLSPLPPQRGPRLVIGVGIESHWLTRLPAYLGSRRGPDSPAVLQAKVRDAMIPQPQPPTCPSRSSPSRSSHAVPKTR